MSTAHNKRWIGFLAISLNVLFWGLSPVIIKEGLNNVPPEVFLFYRFLFVVLLSSPLVLVFYKRFLAIRKKSDWLRLLLIGLFTNPLCLIVLFTGMKYTTSSAAAMIAATVPLFVIFGSWIFLHEKITRYEIFGSLIATFGMGVIITNTPIQSHAENPFLGNLLVVGHNVLWTTGILLMKKYAKKYKAFVFGYTGWVIGLLFMSVIVWFTRPTWILQPSLLFSTPQALYPILYMAVFGSFVAFTAYQVAQQYLSASETSIFTYLEPLVTIPLSVLWLKERLSPSLALGMILLAAGVIVAEKHTHSRWKKIRSTKKK